jgi:hypothetical protein
LKIAKIVKGDIAREPKNLLFVDVYCQIKDWVKRTFPDALVRTRAILAVLLSSNALYPALLGILAAAVTHHPGGMVVAEDILRGDRCIFYFQNRPRFSEWPPLSGG